MRKLLVLATTALISTAALADDLQFDNLSKSDVENVSREFGANFSHTGVSAPETNGIWGIEVGVIAGQSSTPELKDVVDASGGNGSDFKNLYHAGAMVRAHFPLDLFAEVSILPEQEISDAKIKNSTFEVGWNAGGFFNLPLDLAVGYNMANSELSFKQEANGSVPASNIDLSGKTNILWVGVSKTFLFITPYFKVGTVKSDADLKATAQIFQYTADQKEEVSNDGSYLALGANLQFAFFKLGVEGSKIMDVSRASAKISLDF
jgi:hypothetical protein